MDNLKTRRKRKKEKNSEGDAGFKKAKKSNVVSEDSTSSSDSAEHNRSKERDSRKMAKQKRKKSKYDDSSDERSAKHRKKKSKRSSKHKKKLKKHKKGRKHDEEKQQTGNEMSSLQSCLLPPKVTDEAESQENPIIGPLISAAQANPEEPKKRSMVPMTKEEYEKQQSVIRRVYDPDTGRNRLIKGDGEVIEEIVSYSRQKQINKQATKGDAASFQKMMGLS